MNIPLCGQIRVLSKRVPNSALTLNSVQECALILEGKAPRRLSQNRVSDEHRTTNRMAAAGMERPGGYCLQATEGTRGPDLRCPNPIVVDVGERGHAPLLQGLIQPQDLLALADPDAGTSGLPPHLIGIRGQRGDNSSRRLRRFSGAKSGSAVRSGRDLPGPAITGLLNVTRMKAHWNNIPCRTQGRDGTSF